MQLGKKKNVGLYDALNSEMAVAEEILPVMASSSATTTEIPSTPSTGTSEGIQISFTETTSAKVNRDGGVESMDVQGQLNLHISDSTLSRIQIGLHVDDSDGTQFKTHPNVDRNQFKDQHKIGLRDSTRAFPLNQQTSVLRWRLQAKSDVASLPISVNSWPTPAGDGTTAVNIEYEVDSNSPPLEDVTIVIPLPMYPEGNSADNSPGAMPEIREIDGEWQVTAAGFEWTPPVEQVENGRLEFNVQGDDPEGFFPVEVRYRTGKPVCAVDVTPPRGTKLIKF
jgi:coatomer subunit delta